jgi:sugar phosphate isomerase/epimerase
MYSRRELATITLAGLAAPLFGRFARSAGGVRLGVRTCSFNGLADGAGVDPIDTLIDALRACGVHECELFAPQIEARFGSEHAGHHTMSAMSPQMMRRELRKWRLRTPTAYFRAIGERFRKAGVEIYAFNYSPNPSFSDEEIDRGFEMAKALGAEIVTSSTTLDMAKRIAPFAARHQTIVALQGGSRVDDTNDLGTPQSLAAAIALSKYFKVSLDIGDFTAANFDAVAYLRDHHRDVVNLRLKDRRKNQGENLPWGEGDTPIGEVLRLLKREGWPIRAYVDYDYAGRSSAVDEVKRCLAYAAEAMV